MDDLDAACKLEWLETNGLGGFASSTILGLNTRRYHGLLTAATNPPVGRVLLLSKLEETLVIEGRRYELASNRYPGTIHPQGYRYLREFRLDPCPVWVFEVEGAVLEKRVFMVQGENTTVVEYELSGGGALELRPLIAFRDYHATTHRNDAINPHFETRDGVVVLRPYPGLPSLYLSHNAASVDPGAGWYLNFEFDVERERGLDFSEDLFNPLVLRFAAGSPARVIASTALAPHASERCGARTLACSVATPRDARSASTPRTPSSLIERLTAAADQFIVQRGDFKTVIAGYHWFTDWGRDTMIALPGLTLATGRHEIAKQILLAFAESLDCGMLPNRFPDGGEAPEYNTVDATLWFFEAVRAYCAASRDYRFVRTSLYPKLREIVEWHIRGTRYGIHVDDDGLLACGADGVQLTWMDAKVGDWVVTPRRGKPVEIQALWYNALRVLQELAERFWEEFPGDLADRARASFAAQFWNEEAGCLYDVVDGDTRDPSIRPNQIFAISLPYRILEDDDRARRLLEVVERELVTPLGLRTLSPRDPAYRGRYEGDVVSRDSAYHQGTVWPWLMGAYVTACRKVRGESPDWMAAFEAHLGTACLGQISEIADGDWPHTPRGCVAQAWSVAELLRAACDIL